MINRKVIALAASVIGVGGVGIAMPTAAFGTPAEKVTICHATGSETNPFVVIEVSANSQAAHEANHGDAVFGGEGCGNQG